MDKDTTERYKNRRAWDYDVVSEGYRYHLTNIMASVGVSQIKRVEEFMASRQRVCQAYNEAFAKNRASRSRRPISPMCRRSFTACACSMAAATH